MSSSSSSYCLTTNLASGYDFFLLPPKLRDCKVLSNLKYHPPGCQKTCCMVNPSRDRNLACEDMLLHCLFLFSPSPILPILKKCCGSRLWLVLSRAWGDVQQCVGGRGLPVQRKVNFIPRRCPLFWSISQPSKLVLNSFCLSSWCPLFHACSHCSAPCDAAWYNLYPALVN